MGRRKGKETAGGNTRKDFHDPAAGPENARSDGKYMAKV